MKSVRIEIKWAIIFMLVTLAWMLLEKSAGLHDKHIENHAVYTNFFAIPAIALYVVALLDKRKNDYNGIMTYKQGFISGLLLTLFITILQPLTTYLTVKYITPGFFEHAIAYTVATGKQTPEDAAAYFNLESYIWQGIISAPVMGLVTTAIVAIFTKKKAIALH